MDSDQKAVNVQLDSGAMEAGVTDVLRVDEAMWSMRQKLQKHLCRWKSLFK